MKIGYTSRRASTSAYICSQRLCRKVLNVELSGIKIEPHKLLWVFYGFAANYNSFQMQELCEISEPTLIKVKNKLLFEIKRYVESTEKIGGEDMECKLMKRLFVMAE